jgi:uncharacterized protein with ParB-like and HNH nuclease domain
MSYHSKSISQVIDDIEFERAFLPAIQRKFVWPRWKIERLFDSLMRNYPIGSFLFWELKKEQAQNYVFYNFLKNYDERNPYNVRKDGSFRHGEIIGVLDGQQRLSSLYLGFQGSHRERKKYKKGLSDESFPQTFLYLNLLSLPYFINNQKDEPEEIRDEPFEFSFLTQDEANQSSRNIDKEKSESVYWFRVKNVLDYSSEPDYYNKVDKIVELLEDEKQIQSIINNKIVVKTGIERLHKRTLDKLINYFQVENADLDDILEIFIRVNSGGTILSKTDLLFSTIVATWEDGRDEIEAFIREINQIGDGFWFNNDFLMRSCLVLSDLPVLFKVNSFKSENVQLIKDNWESIKKALTKTVETISDFGFSGSVLTSQNAVIVIAYHFMKGGNDSKTSIEGIRKYLLHSLLKNVYGGQGDQVIGAFRKALRVEGLEENDYTLESKDFDFDKIASVRLPANKSLKIYNDDIEEFLNYKKGANSFFVLSLLYPHLRYSDVHFHQDHIHPDKGFTNAKLKAAEIDEDKWAIWQEIKDTLPNLQMMEGKQNMSKNAKPLNEWVKGTNGRGILNVPDEAKFCSDNYIPIHIGFDFKSFDRFYAARKEILKEQLTIVLGIKDQIDSEV